MKLPDWLRFVGLPLIALGVVVAVTVSLRRDLERAQTEQIARVVESESGAARSRLVRSSNSLLSEIRDLHAYWAENAMMPPSEWAPADNVEIDKYQGLDFVIWWESERGVHLLRNDRHRQLDFEPGPEEWLQYQEYRDATRGLVRDEINGPFQDAAGQHYFIVNLLPQTSGTEGTLVARINIQDMLDTMLADDSPGYAIAIHWGDQRIYERGEPGPRQPAEWTKSGDIHNDFGVTWTMTLAPTRELADSLSSKAIGLVRIAGLLIAILMVVLLIENGRATRKARLATRAEKQIKALNRELEAKVRQRTREVAERSQDLLTITDSVGHDLRNPLNAISTNLELLELQFGEALGEDGRALLRQSETSLAGTTDILDRLLELSSVFSDRFTAETIDMQRLVRETFDELLRHDPTPPAELVLGELPEAHGEKILVRTLLMNLLGNALKYSRGEQMRRITVRARRTGDEVVYSISDNGVGFDDAVAERMFKAYERLGGDTEGLGLGLDIAARAVHRHHGRIWATGEPGVGASFYFTLGAAPTSA